MCFVSKRFESRATIDPRFKHRSTENRLSSSVDAYSADHSSERQYLQQSITGNGRFP